MEVIANELQPIQSGWHIGAVNHRRGAWFQEEFETLYETRRGVAGQGAGEGCVAVEWELSVLVFCEKGGSVPTRMRTG